MTELDAWRFIRKCPGAEIYIGVNTISVVLEGQRFMGDSIILVVLQMIEAGF